VTHERGEEVIEMDAEARTAGARTLVAVVAALFAAAAVWAAVGLAAGGSSESSSGFPTSVEPAAYVQAQEDGTAPVPGDCPEGEGGSGESEDGSGSSGTSTGDL
jgi:hypothetical protein